MSRSGERVWITGTGIVTGAGASVDAVWQVLESGRTAVAEYQQWDSARWPRRVAAEVQENDRTLVPDRKLHKSISRIDMVGIYAADQAIGQSTVLEHRESLPENETDTFNDRTGIVVGTGGGNYKSNYDYLPLISEVGGEMPAFGQQLGNVVSPMWLLRNLPNNVLCHVGIRAQFKGTNGCITNQCVGGVQAIGEAAAAVACGEADRMLAVGHDTPLEPEMVYYYHRLGLMSDQAPRPFDRNRNGTAFGEGAGALFLEREASVAGRGAPVLGEYLGSGCCTEATGILDLRKDGDGVARAIRLALEDAGLTPDEIGFVVAHGNGTPASDLSEAKGIRTVFGDRIPPVTSFKWAYGHLIAASGMVDVVMALEVIRRQSLPGIATLVEKDPLMEYLPVAAGPVTPRSSVGLVICRGFGGMNVAVIVGAA